MYTPEVTTSKGTRVIHFISGQARLLSRSTKQETRVTKLRCRTSRVLLLAITLPLHPDWLRCQDLLSHTALSLIMILLSENENWLVDIVVHRFCRLNDPKVAWRDKEQVLG